MQNNRHQLNMQKVFIQNRFMQNCRPAGQKSGPIIFISYPFLCYVTSLIGFT